MSRPQRVWLNECAACRMWEFSVPGPQTRPAQRDWPCGCCGGTLFLVPRAVILVDIEPGGVYDERTTYVIPVGGAA